MCIQVKQLIEREKKKMQGWTWFCPSGIDWILGVFRDLTWVAGCPALTPVNIIREQMLLQMGGEVIFLFKIMMVHESKK